MCYLAAASVVLVPVVNAAAAMIETDSDSSSYQIDSCANHMSGNGNIESVDMPDAHSMGAQSTHAGECAMSCAVCATIVSAFEPIGSPFRPTSHWVSSDSRDFISIESVPFYKPPRF